MKKIKLIGMAVLCLSLMTGCATYQMRKGDGLMLRGDYDRASKAYSKALKHKDVSEAYLKRGIALEKSGKVDDAIRDFSLVADKGIGISKNASLYKGELLLKQGELDKALAVSDRLVIENPEDVTAHSLRAEIWFARGDYKQALDDFNKSLERVRNDDSLQLKLLYNRTVTLFKLGKFREARLAYRNYIDERKTMGKDIRQKDYYNMGLFCYCAYDFDGARKYWQELPCKKREEIAANISEETLKDLADY